MWKSGNCVFARERTPKIKLSRVCVSPWFMLFWYALPRPVMFTIHRRHHSHYLKFMDSLGLHFGLKIKYLSLDFSNDFFIALSKPKAKPRQRPWQHPEGEGGTLRRDHRGGSLRWNHSEAIMEESWKSNIKASGGNWTTFWGHLGRIWKVLGGHLKGISKPSGRYLKGIWDASGIHVADI